MRQGLVMCGLVFLAGQITPRDARGDYYVNVSKTWCDGECHEGHDKFECVCELYPGKDGHSSNPDDYWDCYVVQCCEIFEHWVDWDGNPCDPNDCVFTADGQCDGGCDVFYTSGAENYAYVSTYPGSNLTFANETGWYHECSLSGQSPWDDSGHYGFVSD